MNKKDKNQPFSTTVEVHLSKCSYSKQLPNCVGQSDHNWSGWPGAYCQTCGVGGPAEYCMGGCKCHCHFNFWEEYSQACTEFDKEECEFVEDHKDGGTCMHCTPC